LLLASWLRETASRARKRVKKSANAKAVTATIWEWGGAGAGFDLAPKLGSVSDGRAATVG